MSRLDDVDVTFYVEEGASGWGRVGAEAQTRDGYGWAGRQVADVIGWANLDRTGMTQVDENSVAEYLKKRKWPSPGDHVDALRHIVASQAFEVAAPKRWPPT